MSGKAKFALWLLMGLVLSACGQRVGLAPVVHGGSGETFPSGSTISAMSTYSDRREDVAAIVKRLSDRSTIDDSGQCI